MRGTIMNLLFSFPGELLYVLLLEGSPASSGVDVLDCQSPRILLLHPGHGEESATEVKYTKQN